MAWKESAAELGPDVVVIKRWNATMDTRVRPEHAAMNGAEALLDGAYSTGETYPGQNNPWNCRCVETYRVERVKGTITARTPLPPAIVPEPTAAPRPAARLEDFITGRSSPTPRMRAGVNLEGIKKKELEEIRSGLDAVLTPVGVKVDGISVQAMRGAQGLYTQTIGPMESRFRTITFSKKYANSPLDALEQGRVYANRQAERISAAERRLADPQYPAALRAREQQRLDLMRVPTRWTVGSTSGRSTFSTAAHEAGHAILPPSTPLNREWSDAVRQVPRREWLRVSEYANTNADELWAEITTLRALGRAREVPSELLRIYESIYARIQGTP
jgi:hypothetical protein